VEFSDNIVWQNRQFFFWVDTTSGCTPGDPFCVSTFGLCPDVTGALECPGGNDVVFDDLGVIGTAGTLTGLTNLVTPGGWTAPGPTDPSTLFVEEYFNGARSAVFQTEFTTGIQTPAAFDEGGNYIRPGYGPLSLYDDLVSNNGDPGTLFGDYHILSSSDAFAAGTDLTGTYPALLFDFDMQDRPNGDTDIGADEYYGSYPAPAVVDLPDGGVADAMVAETEDE
jgi:hypothetical protein